ncbi:MAG: amidohydrolase family protein, partial [Candidatus Hydrogenedentes bacterium]|nr:amidohydrolase family protein [Candidatus Hydrogenedentota bacterium]
MIIDSHAHVFPFLGSRAGFPSEQAHLDAIQSGMHKHLAQPVRRKRDHVIVENNMLWDDDNPSIKGKAEVNFRVTKHGRFEWRKDGVDYYIHYMPPNLQTMEASPEFLKIMMEYVGIDRAVLQCGAAYGKFNSYYINVIQEYGDIFIPLYEPEPDARKEKGLRQLSLHSQLGFRGIWVAGFQNYFDEKYNDFWDLVEELDLVVFWGLHPNEYNEMNNDFIKWLENRSSITNVMAQSFPMACLEAQGTLRLPSYAFTLAEFSNVLFELAFPISEGANEDYPFPKSREAVALLYDFFGSRRLVWGSDIPNVERYCT